MKHIVRIHPSGAEICVNNEGTILKQAIDAGVILEHSCMKGTCGVCKAKLLTGKIRSDSQTNAEVLTEEEKSQGYVLTCQVSAESDLELEARYFPELVDIKKVLLPCKVSDLEFYSDEILIIKLKLPPTSNFKYLSGQYIQLIIKGQRRSYSIANSYEDGKEIELHVRRVSNGLFSEYLFNEVKKDELLRIEGPLGSFFVRQGGKPLIFIAGGTGFAPVKAMVEQLVKEGDKREIHIYWGVSNKDLIYSDLPEKWVKEGRIRSVTKVVSDGEWDGRKGNVDQAVMEDFSNLENYDIYACGSQAMIKSTKKNLMRKKMVEENFYSDSFVSSE